MAEHKKMNEQELIQLSEKVGLHLGIQPFTEVVTGTYNDSPVDWEKVWLHDDSERMFELQHGYELHIVHHRGLVMNFTDVNVDSRDYGGDKILAARISILLKLLTINPEKYKQKK